MFQDIDSNCSRKGRWQRLLPLLIVLGIAPGACANLKAPGAPQLIVLNSSNCSQRVRLGLRDTVRLELPSNRSTGYAWELRSSNAGALDAVGKPAYEIPPTGTLGQSGIERFSLVSRAVGEGTLELYYRRPFEERPQVPKCRIDFSVANR